MKRIVFVLSVFAIIAQNGYCRNSNSSQRMAARKLSQKTAPAIVYLTSPVAGKHKYIGSGFIIESEGVVITNYHLIMEAKEINIKTQDNRYYSVTGVIYYDVTKDIAVLRVDAGGLSALKLGSPGFLEAGGAVYANNNSLGADYSFAKTRLLRKENQRGLGWLVFSGSFPADNSGGPLLNSRGQVIGVVTFLAKNRAGENFALAIDEIKPNLSRFSEISFRRFAGLSKRADYFFIHGTEAYLRREYNQAIKQYQKAIRENPEFIEAYNNIGAAYGMLRQPQDAIQYFQKVAKVDPDYPKIYYEIAVSHSIAGQHREAIDYYQKSVQRNPDFAEAYNNIGVAYASLGSYQQAIVSYQKGIQKDPMLARIYNNLGTAYGKLNRHRESIIYFQKAIQKSHNFTEAYNNLGAVYGSSGNYQQAINYCQQAIQINQDFSKAYYNLGVAYASTGRHQAAVKFFKKAIKTNPNYADAYYSLGAAYGSLGKYHKVQENLLKAKRIFQEQKNLEESLNYPFHLQDELLFLY